ncbi:hypothetical protein LTR85_006443 [Meristemomyces frigidus]|nr:hypothetical protein LTR85_006443 [Meristemomyces frigidus]
MAHNGHDRGHNGYSGDNGYQGHNASFGFLPDFSFDNMHLDNTPNAFNQTAILSQNDSDMLGGFFADPDNSKASDSFSQNFNFGMDGKVDGNGLGDGRGNQFSFGAPATAVDTTSTMAGAYGTGYQTHPNIPQMPFADQHSGWSGNGPRMTAEAAASALSSLSQDQTHAPMGGSNPIAGSWGSMNVGGVPATGSSESPATPSSRHSSGDFLAPNNHTYLLAQAAHQTQLAQLMAQQQQQYQPRQHQQTGPRARQQSLNINTGAAQAYPFSQGLPHSAAPYPQYLYQFGSDPNITGFPYAAPGYVTQTQGKEHNLFNLPLAAEAAKHGRAHSHVMGQPSQRAYHMQDMSSTRGFQSSNSSPGVQYGGLPINNPSPTTANHQQRAQQQQQWSSRQAGNSRDSDEDDEELEERQPRKRRKSQMQREEEAEYRPERQMEGTIPKRGPKVPKAEVAIDDEDDPYTPINKSSLKRRRSTATAPASGSASPDDLASPPPGDASGSKRRSRDSKSRSNLSDNQKRQNHILSEQKRRNVIKQGYHDLNRLVPTLSAGKSGLSKSEILKEVVTYLENVIDGNEAIMERCGFAEDDLDPASDTIEAY